MCKMLRETYNPKTRSHHQSEQAIVVAKVIEIVCVDIVIDIVMDVVEDVDGVEVATGAVTEVDSKEEGPTRRPLPPGALNPLALRM